MAHQCYVGKFEPTLEGLFSIEQVYQGRSYQLIKEKGECPMFPISLPKMRLYKKSLIK